MDRMDLTKWARGAFLLAALLWGPLSTAQAGDWSFSFGFHAPHSHLDYHHHHVPRFHHRLHYAPLHYDHVYHPDYYHWTPDIGFHSHGHYHIVPHYAPPAVHYHHYHW